jgi:HPr kinase/phosphorylase
MSERPHQIHGAAVAVAFDWDGPLAGALIVGRSGSGKSALAVSLIEACPWRRTALVADDVVLASRRGEAIFASAPERLAGLIEIRGFGPARVRAVFEARLVAAFDLSLPPERLPEPRSMAVGEGARLPLWPFHADGDSPSRLRAIVRSVLGRQLKQRAHDSESIWL